MTHPGCGERTLFTAAELVALDARGEGHHVLEDGYSCELDSAHPGPHLLLAQAYNDGELWLAWDGEHRELLLLAPCEAEESRTDDLEPELCTLPADHYGRHSFEMDSHLTGRIPPL